MATKRDADPARLTAKISTRGRIVIPIELRRRHGISGPTKVLIGETHGKIVVEPWREDGVMELRGELAPWSFLLEPLDDTQDPEE